MGYCGAPTIEDDEEARNSSGSPPPASARATRTTSRSPRTPPTTGARDDRRRGDPVPAARQGRGGAARARPRPRRPVRAADRPPRPRLPRLLRARRSPDHGRRGSTAQPGGADPERRTRPPSTPRVRRGSTPASTSWACPCSASATARSSWLSISAAPSSEPASPSSARPICAQRKARLFAGLPEEQTAWMSHRDTVTAPPEGATVTAESPHTPVAAFEAPERGLYGVQFHPEVVHTPHGQEVLKNFLYGVAQMPPTWTAAAVIEEQVARIRAQVGNERVLCALSGGVDSSVAALLVHKAVGDQLTCVFVDHGLLRKDEAPQVVETFRRHFHVPLVHVDAEARFLARLDGVTDPEEKRRRVGEEFIRVFEEEAATLGQHEVPRPGHALLGRDRVGRRGRRGGEDQVAPQRGRAARGDGLRARRAAPLAVQGRGAARRRGAGPAGGDGLAAPVPRPRALDPHHRRGHARAARDPARGRRDPARGGAASRALPRALAVLRRAPRDQVRRRAGRRAHLRVPDRDPRGHLGRRDDSRLGAPALRPAGDDLEPDRQRDSRP